MTNLFKRLNDKVHMTLKMNFDKDVKLEIEKKVNDLTGNLTSQIQSLTNEKTQLLSKLDEIENKMKEKEATYSLSVQDYMTKVTQHETELKNKDVEWTNKINLLKDEYEVKLKDLSESVNRQVTERINSIGLVDPSTIPAQTVQEKTPKEKLKVFMSLPIDQRAKYYNDNKVEIDLALKISNNL